MAIMQGNMRTVLVLLGIFALALLAGLAFWRQLDHRADRAEMARLISLQPPQPPLFDAGMVRDLPEPAKRFFLYAIEPGTPLRTVAEIEMEGRFGMGTKADPGYMDMTARQVLAAPWGFVWAMETKGGPMPLGGSDSGKWTRFWLAGLVPVARIGGTADHRSSAFGRYVAEAVFWTPAAVLPGPGVRWEPLGPDSARVTVEHDGLRQAVDVTVDTDGKPTQVAFQRWSNANPEKAYRLQPFGGQLSNFQSFGGFRLPTHVEAGNMWGTDEYFPFFVVDVTGVRFPEPAD